MVTVAPAEMATAMVVAEMALPPATLPALPVDKPVRHRVAGVVRAAARRHAPVAIRAVPIELTTPPAPLGAEAGHCDYGADATVLLPR